MFGLQKSYRLLELPEKHRVVLQICCSFPQIGPIALMEWVHLHLSLRPIRYFVVVYLFWYISFYVYFLFWKASNFILTAVFSSKSNYLSEGNLEKQYLSQIRVWLTKIYDTKCLQAKNLKNWSKVFKDWIQLVQFINLGLCPSPGLRSENVANIESDFLKMWSLGRCVSTWLAAETFICGAPA